MLRLSPEGFYRFIQARKFDINYGGSEANVAFSLANYGMDVEFVTKLPDNEIGQAALNTLRQYNVNINHIKKEGERLGIYYMEKGASQRPSKIIYDRAFSAIAMANIEDFNWDEIFKDAKWFHLSGITPALSDTLSKISLIACKKAKKYGLIISCDLNYRSKLWTQKEANKVMGEIIKYVDVCIANEEDIDKVFGIKAKNTDVEHGKINYDSYENVAKEVYDKYDCKYVACTLRTSISASINKLTAVCYDGQMHQSKEYTINVVDRVGGGDSFAAGLIYGLIKQQPIQETLEFATAASVLKHTIEGDFNLVTLDEVKNLAQGNESGRVQR